MSTPRVSPSPKNKPPVSIPTTMAKPAAQPPPGFSRRAMVLWLIAIGMILFFIPLFLLAGIVRDEVAGLSADIASAQRSLTEVPTPQPQLRRVLTPLAKVQSQIQDITQVYPTLEAGRTNWATLMAAIANYDPRQISLTNLTRDDAQITVSGRAVDDGDVIAYANALENSNVFARVIVQSIQITDTQVTIPTLTPAHTETPNPAYTPRWPLNAEGGAGTNPQTPSATGDEFEPDAVAPKPIAQGQPQKRSFYPDGDVDKATFLAKAGRYYRVSTKNPAPGVDPVLHVTVNGVSYDNDDAKSGTLASEVVFQNQGADATALITVTNRGQYGVKMTYTLLVEELLAPPTQTTVAGTSVTPAPSMTPILTSTPVPPTVTPQRTSTAVPPSATPVIIIVTATRSAKPSKTATLSPTTAPTKTPTAPPTATRRPTKTRIPTGTPASAPIETPTPSETPTPTAALLPLQSLTQNSNGIALQVSGLSLSGAAHLTDELVEFLSGIFDRADPPATTEDKPSASEAMPYRFTILLELKAASK